MMKKLLAGIGLASMVFMGVNGLVPTVSAADNSDIYL